MHSREKGQALVELALAAPVLLLLLWGTVFVVRAFHARLDLLDLTREFAVLISRNDPPPQGNQAWQQDLKTLAFRMGMDSEAVSMKLEPLFFENIQIPSEGQITGIGGKSLGLLAEMAAGQRLTITYISPIKIPLFHKKLTLEESVALKTNPWRHPSQQGLTSALSK